MRSFPFCRRSNNFKNRSSCCTAWCRRVRMEIENFGKRRNEVISRLPMSRSSIEHPILDSASWNDSVFHLKISRLIPLARVKAQNILAPSKGAGIGQGMWSDGLRKFFAGRISVDRLGLAQFAQPGFVLRNSANNPRQKLCLGRRRQQIAVVAHDRLGTIRVDRKSTRL